MAGNSTENTSEADDLSYTASKATFLVLFIIVGTVGNVSIIISVIGTKRLRSSSLHLFTVNLAVVNLLECLFCISITLASTITGSWQIPEVLCKLDAFFFNTLWIEMILGITFMTMDRMMAVRLPNKYSEIHNPPRIFIMIAYTWVHSAVFSLPLAVEVVPVDSYTHINVCIMSTNSSLSYIGALSTCCFVIPIIIIVSLLIITIKTVYAERKAHQELLTRHHYSSEIEEPKFFKELVGAKFAGSLFVCWMILVAPFLTAVFINLYKVSEINSISDFENTTYSSLIYLIFLKAKYFYVIVLPFFVLFLKKECWQSFKDIVLCRKHNTVDVENKVNKNRDSVSNGTVEQFSVEEEKKREKEEKNKEAFVHNSGFQVPVLFATSNGVHIQTYGLDDSSESDEPIIRGRKCDVIGSQDNLQYVGDDTSDYDSGNELDPFSVSHPISSKQIKDKDANVLQKRSNSQPEVRGNKKLSDGVTESKTSVTLTSAADSGLDISSRGGAALQDSNKSLSRPFITQNNISEPGFVNIVSKTKVQKHEKFNDSSQDLVAIENKGDHEMSKENIAQGVINGAFESESQECNNVCMDIKSPVKDLVNESDITEKDGARNSKSLGRTGAEDLSLTLPTLPRKKKKSKKSSKSNKCNETFVSTIDPGDLDSHSVDAGAIPPRPPPRLAPISKTSKHSTYQRMPEETEIPNNAQTKDSSATSLKKTGKVTLPCEVSESNQSDSLRETSKAKLKPSLKNTKRRGTFDSQTSLLGSCSSADMKILKDVGFVSSDDSASQLSPNSLEVTTPSACQLVDVHKDFDQALQNQKND